MRVLWVTGALVGALGFAAPPALADPCERTLAPSPAAGPDGYRRRAGGARCEGIYVSPVSGTPAELVSLTRGRLTYDIAHPTVLLVTLDQPSASVGAHLRAVGVPRGLYYEMDADIVGGQAVAWPVGEVLARRQIRPDQVGVLALRRDASSDTVYFPVDVTPAGGAPARKQPIVLVLRVVDVADLKWRFVPARRVASNAYSAAVADGDRVEVALPSAAGPPVGTFEVRWVDPDSGATGTRTFRVGG